MHLVGHLAREGVLTHLAIAVTDPAMLSTLYHISQSPGSSAY